jgi:hypothetical protein
MCGITVRGILPRRRDSVLFILRRRVVFEPPHALPGLHLTFWPGFRFGPQGDVYCGSSKLCVCVTPQGEEKGERGTLDCSKCPDQEIRELGDLTWLLFAVLYQAMHGRVRIILALSRAPYQQREPDGQHVSFSYTSLLLKTRTRWIA